MNYKRLFLLLFPLLFFLFTPHFGIQFFCLIVLIIFTLSFFYSWVCWSGFTSRRLTTIQRTYRGQNLEIHLEIANTGLLPIYQLYLADQHAGLSSTQAHKRLQELLRARSTIDLKYIITGKKRGAYTIGPLSARGIDPIGLFPWQKTFSETELIIVYPRVFQLRQLKDDKGLPCGSLKTANPVFEDITNYKSLREYTPGDDLRRINWKVSARMGTLYTMQYLPSLRFAAVVLLNLDPEAYPIKMRYHYLEAAIDTAASLIYHCIYQKQEAGLLTAGILQQPQQAGLLTTGVLQQQQQVINFPLRKDEGHAVQILEILACIQPDDTREDIFSLLTASGVKLPWGCRILYVGPPPGETQLYTLLKLARSGMFPELFIPYTWKQEQDFGIPVHTYTQSEEVT